LHEAARSCAKVLGATTAPNGEPLEYVNEHIRIWGAIWDKGRQVEIALPESKGTVEE